MVARTSLNEQVRYEPRVTAFDQVPYESRPYAASHPERLALLSTFFGMKPRPVNSAKVLELGCASGGNLIAMAQSLPGSEFLGVDLSKEQVAQGRQTIRELGLKNVEIQYFDLMETSDLLGTFDYIIAHGLFSYVNETMQEKILEICRENLNPEGVAFVSYNTYPGWHMRGMIRDMMLYHTQSMEDPNLAGEQAGALLNFLAQSSISAGQAFGIKAYEAMLKEEQEFLRQLPQSYLLHEHLAPINHPLYFHQFVDRAHAHGLQYLAEAEFSTMLLSNYPLPVQEGLSRVGKDLVQTEQYMDFVRNRTFRQTLLCRKEINLDRTVPPESVTGMYVASSLKPVAPKVAVNSFEPQTFQLGDVTFTPSKPIVKAAFTHLSEIYPLSEAFPDLLEAACARVGSGKKKGSEYAGSDAQDLAADILLAYAINVAELRMQKDSFTTAIKERPAVCALARYQIKSTNVVTNRLHQSVSLDVFCAHLVNLLDGSLNKASLLDELVKLAQADIIAVYEDGKKLEDEKLLRDSLRRHLEEGLAKLAGAALLTDS